MSKICLSDELKLLWFSGELLGHPRYLGELLGHPRYLGELLGHPRYLGIVFQEYLFKYFPLLEDLTIHNLSLSSLVCLTGDKL